MASLLLTIAGDGYEFKQQVEGDLEAAIAAFEAAFAGATVTGYDLGEAPDITTG